jgi:hypothetical protein
MNWQAVIGGIWVASCMTMLGVASPTSAADAACGDGAACAPLDDSNTGDNQSGDAGAEREAPDDKQKS